MITNFKTTWSHEKKSILNIKELKIVKNNVILKVINLL
jgi:hypothetical protein